MAKLGAFERLLYPPLAVVEAYAEMGGLTMKTFDAAKVNEIFEDEKRQAVSGVAYAAISAAQNRINHLPDTGARKRGQWVMRGLIPFCSECGERAPLKETSGGWKGYKKSKVCPECGAWMANYDR